MYSYLEGHSGWPMVAGWLTSPAVLQQALLWRVQSCFSMLEEKKNGANCQMTAEFRLLQICHHLVKSVRLIQ